MQDIDRDKYNTRPNGKGKKHIQRKNICQKQDR